jgi:hypothetical protein
MLTQLALSGMSLSAAAAFVKATSPSAAAAQDAPCSAAIGYRPESLHQFDARAAFAWRAEPARDLAQDADDFISEMARSRASWVGRHAIRIEVN